MTEYPLGSSGFLKIMPRAPVQTLNQTWKNVLPGIPCNLNQLFFLTPSSGESLDSLLMIPGSGTKQQDSTAGTQLETSCWFSKTEVGAVSCPRAANAFLRCHPEGFLVLFLVLVGFFFNYHLNVRCFPFLVGFAPRPCRGKWFNFITLKQLYQKQCCASSCSLQIFLKICFNKCRGGKLQSPKE